MTDVLISRKSRVEQMDNRNTIAKNAVVLTLSGLTVKIIGFFFRIPLGRLLTASGMGDYSPAYEIYSFALLFSTAGLPVAVAKMQFNHDTGTFF